MDYIYLDNSATTALSDTAKQAMTEAMNLYGNPSSLHGPGQISATRLSEFRQKLLSACGIRDGFHVFFTGSGSEANNMAITGAASAGKHYASKRILTTDSEHPSVHNSAAYASSRFGFEYVQIPTRGGVLDLDFLEKELKKGAAIVSFMLVNNETGALYDIESASKLVRKYCPDAFIHCDCVQGFTRVKLPIKSVDAFTVSAHKIHGPKGCAALFLSDAAFRRHTLVPLINGGGQEESLRAGTENLVCIAGFAAAACEANKKTADNSAILDNLFELASQKIAAAGCRLNVPPVHVSHILSVTLPDIKSQTMLSFLSAKGICVSAGSACSSKDRHISPSLHAFGLSDSEADSTIRVSLCADNTAADIDALASALADGVSRLVRIHR